MNSGAQAGVSPARCSHHCARTAARCQHLVSPTDPQPAATEGGTSDITCLQTLLCPPRAPAHPPLSLATGVIAGHWPAHATWHFSLRGSKKGKEMTAIQSPEDTSVSPRSQLDGRSFAQRNVEVGTRPHPRDTARRDTACSEETG